MDADFLLLHRMRHGDDQAVEDFVRKYYPRVLRYCHLHIYDTGYAEDLTQDTFYQAYCSFGRYNGECEMFTWLASIAKNVFLKHLRKHKNEIVPIDLYVTEPEAPLTDEPGYRLSRQVEAAELRAAIAAMPKKYSEVLILRIYGELSYEEIAAKLGISVNSAKVIFHRAKKIIKEILLNE